MNMNTNSPLGSVEQVEQLLLTYQQEHPFLTIPEHTDERGLSTERFYQDVLAHTLIFSQQMQDQAQAQGITTHTFRLSRGRRIGDSYHYDLSIDQRIVLADSHYQEVHEYALQHMENQDLYLEAPAEMPITGRELRKSHNYIQDELAADTTYIPKYSYQPGPFTSERQEEEHGEGGAGTEPDSLRDQ